MWITVNVLYQDNQLASAGVDNEFWVEGAIDTSQLEAVKKELDSESNEMRDRCWAYFKSGESFILNIPMEVLLELVGAQHIENANA